MMFAGFSTSQPFLPTCGKEVFAGTWESISPADERHFVTGLHALGVRYDLSSREFIRIDPSSNSPSSRVRFLRCLILQVYKQLSLTFFYHTDTLLL